MHSSPGDGDHEFREGRGDGTVGGSGRMTATRHQLLEVLVAHHERQETPITAAELASHVDGELAVVTEHLDSLERCALLKEPADSDGYVPTTTAHELLALDIRADALVVVDTCQE